MTGTVDPTVVNLIVFVLAVFVGYHVIWNVTPALHTPLMSVTNAISSVIIVGAIFAAGSAALDFGSVMGAVAVGLAAVNVAGGAPSIANTNLIQVFGLSGHDALSLNESNGGLPRAHQAGRGGRGGGGAGGNGGDIEGCRHPFSDCARLIVAQIQRGSISRCDGGAHVGYSSRCRWHRVI